MRIISGKYGGHVLRPPAGLPVRPTTERAKESLFNILNNQYHFENLTVLELFAGTGGISLEFASREAQEIIAVDQHIKCCKFITQSAKQFNCPQLHVVHEDAQSFIRDCPQAFDIIFADPPYQMKNQEELIQTIFNNNLLKPHGTLIWEHYKNLNLESLPHYKQTRKYGDSAFSFFSYE